MLFARKQETYTISEFLNRGKAVANEQGKTISKAEATHYGLFGGLTLGMLSSGSKAFASDGGEAVTVMASGDMYSKMMHAFDPLIDLVQALAYPVCMVVVLGGALFIMIGNKEKGFSMMQSAGLGYVLVQMTPMVLNILVQAMKAV